MSAVSVQAVYAHMALMSTLYEDLCPCKMLVSDLLASIHECCI